MGTQRTGLIIPVNDGICGDGRTERPTRSFDVKQAGDQHYGSERQHEHRACQPVNFAIHPALAGIVKAGSKTQFQLMDSRNALDRVLRTISDRFIWLFVCRAAGTSCGAFCRLPITL
jgi:hypothetical protein